MDGERERERDKRETKKQFISRGQINLSRASV